ncbi:hypothetical protein G6F57_013297 [Rhizopus arrhizus]|uniref:Uncharacterized protein n=1 Tax=Rhizopus oryzae TaxID=64495 RepID=A0A9P6WYG0_RHIOR|nr:hypothetical protein G6F23_010797 [Rhizopus arrhizus]KAG1399216.1 hypothetical protein G6F58_011174 [Rhizopus delemar]KAG0909432.1 hypothetical protein G6F33_008789 [Rhizopus arrhizus]KAG0928699.1 hypothetical protein G6F30_012278 [Rhizopus arrhizus]KAG0929915.1 hypothetical protein G6F32_012154 [Rhizopus arrhizus]
MTGLKRKACPNCSSSVELFTINFGCDFEMCENDKCSYPFTLSSVEGLIIEDPSTQKGYSNKKRKALSTTANTAGSYAASVVNSAQSAKDPRQGLISTMSSDFNLKQKDQSHFNSLSIADKDISGKPMPTRSVVEKNSIKSTPVYKAAPIATSRTSRKPSFSLPSASPGLPLNLALPPASAATAHKSTFITVSQPSQPIISNSFAYPTTKRSSHIRNATPPNYKASDIPSVARSTNQSNTLLSNQSSSASAVCNETNSTSSNNSPIASSSSASPTTDQSLSTTPSIASSPNNDLSFSLTDIESLLSSDIESVSGSFIATPDSNMPQTAWLDDLQEIFKSTDVIQSNFDPLAF